MLRNRWMLLTLTLTLLAFGLAAGADEADTPLQDLFATPTAAQSDHCGLAGTAAEPLPVNHHKDPPPPPRACGPCSESLCVGKSEGDICAVGLGVTYCLIYQEPLMCSDGETYNCSCPGA